MNGLDSLTGRILGDAKSYVDEVTSQSNIKIDKILLDYKAEADSVEAEIVGGAKNECEMLSSRAESQRALIERNRLLTEKRSIIDEVFSTAADKLSNLPTDEYVALLSSLVAKYQTQSAEIILNKRDKENISSELLKKIVVNKIKKIDISMIKISDTVGSFRGGLILRQGDIDTNCTAEVLCDGLRHELEPEIIKILGF